MAINDADNVKNKDVFSSNKKLKKKIINEYVFIFSSILITYILLPFLFDYILGDNTGIDGIGQALGIIIIWRILQYLVTFIFFVINPIRILITCRNELKNIDHKFQKIIRILITVFPILFSLLIILQVPIANFMYNLKYETGKNSYSLSYDEYKSPQDFQNELINRGLIYNENSESLLLQLNKKYMIGMNKKYYYEEASLMPLFTKSDYFSDTKDYNDIITFYSSSKAPLYIYNAILTLPSQYEKLQYAAISRYAGHKYLSGSSYPFFEDYYIECKILFVDEDIYAIIGVGQSYDIERYYEEYEKCNMDNMYDYPFYMILSEKETITTFYNGQYYPDGAIENAGDKFEMSPNTNEKTWADHKNYPVRKVDRLDIDTINTIAKELQNGILKDSIEYHFSKYY